MFIRSRLQSRIAPLWRFFRIFLNCRWKVRKFGSGLKIATIKIPLGGDKAPLERLSGRVRCVGWGFRRERVCAPDFDDFGQR
jgi:hypothetical protein